jgi:hypothetical protein
MLEYQRSALGAFDVTRVGGGGQNRRLATRKSTFFKLAFYERRQVKFSCNIENAIEQLKLEKGTL